MVKIIDLSLLPFESVLHEAGVKKKVMIPFGTLPHVVSFSQAYLEPSQLVKSHSHDDKYEVFLVESGVGEILINGEKQELKSGRCVIAKPHESHEIKNTGKETLVLTYFGIEK